MNKLYFNRLRALIWWSAYFIIILFFIVGCTSKAEVQKQVPAAVPAGIPVDASVVKPGILKEELEVTGTLIANQQVGIASELTRKVTGVYVKEGSHVRSGVILFQLDDADLQAQLERLRQQEKLAQLKEERLRDLKSHDAVVEQDYDEAFTNLKVLQAQIKELQVMIDKTRITAPFDGQVGMIDVHPGAIVSVNTILTDIEDNSIIKVEFSVPEKYSNIILPGSEQPFTIVSDNKQYIAKIVAKSARLDADTRTLLVRAVTPNPGNTLLPGQSARLNLALNSSASALSVSSQSLIPSSLGYTLIVVHNKHVQFTPVEIGQRSAGSVEILKGLSAGDTVVTSNLLRLTPGALVYFESIN